MYLRFVILCLLTVLPLVGSCERKVEQKSDNDGNVEKPETELFKNRENSQDKADVNKDPFERLNAISERFIKVTGTMNVISFDTSLSNASVGIDYGMFERLSDSGVAAMIAYKLAAEHLSSTGLSVHMPLDERKVLEADRLAGRYTALAGYKMDGFKQWLQLREQLPEDNTSQIPSHLHLQYFTFGYKSVKQNQI